MKKIKGTFFVEKEYLDNKIFSIQENKKNHYKYSKYISIRDGFLKKGIEINTQDISKESDTDFTIYLDYPKRILAKKKYIIVREPRIIIPNNHNYKKLNKFNKIFTYNDKLVDNTKFIKFINGSYDFSKVKKYKSESQNGYVLICRNKKSFKDGESYSLRNQIITFFESSNLTFDLYGFGWDRKNFNYKIIEVLFNRMKMKRPSSNLYKNYKGTVTNKREKTSEYLFQFSIENSNNTDGYISEKIFDAFFSNNIPIYSGAPNINDFIPKNCFINLNDFSSIKELIIYTESLNAQDIVNFKNEIDKFLISNKAKRFSVQYNSKLLINKIIDDLKI